MIFEPGRIVKGKVTGIKKYGIFVSFENEYIGLIHISEISENFVKDINKYARLGETIPCKILEIKKAEKQVKLTIKNLDYMLRRESHYNYGFEILKRQLPIWVKEKLKEIDNNIS